LTLAFIVLELVWVSLGKESGNTVVESIFEFATVTENGFFNSNYFISQGVRGTGCLDLGWGFNRLQQNLVNAF